VSGKPVKAEALADCGADDNYVSRRVARKLAGTSAFEATKRQVLMLDGRTLSALGRITLTYKIGGYLASLTAYMLEMTDYDLVLGLRWFKEVNP
jgi:hypothetical protein